jgi:prepilin-type N-terminal cleavage/methylation domain-containing protein
MKQQNMRQGFSLVEPGALRCSRLFLLKKTWNACWRKAHGCARPACRASSGFSLVELSIVLVIVGLLVGGIMTGKNLIRASELRSVAADAGRYRTAVELFREQYASLPGDMYDATSYWGTMSSGTCPNATGGVGTETCNGNGDGVLSGASAAGRAGERFTFWQHLANAGIIEGGYPGLAGPAGGEDVEVGKNTPGSKLGLAGWSVVYFLDRTGPTAVHFAGKYGNVIVFGMATDDDFTDNPAITGAEMKRIDDKIDDGTPGQGRMVSFNNSFRSGCVTSNDAVSAIYVMTSKTIACSMILRGL